MEKLAYIFPGQGAQFVGMGKELCDAFPVAKEIFDRANEALGFDLAKLCFEGPKQELSTTSVSQPAILTTSIAFLRVIEAEIPELKPSASLGLSLGEYSALVFARAVSFEDALRLVGCRGRLMDEAGRRRRGGMVSVLGLDRRTVDEICTQAGGPDTLVTANVNCPGQIVLSGDMGAVERAERLALERGASRAVILRVSGAFHSPLMASAQEAFAEALSEVSMQAPRVPFVSNVTGTFEKDADRIKELLVRQLGSPVLWQLSMETLLGDGVVSFMEIGPGSVLRGLLKRIDGRAKCTSVGTVEAVEKS